jgi:hypothetical protein
MKQETGKSWQKAEVFDLEVEGGEFLRNVGLSL